MLKILAVEYGCTTAGWPASFPILVKNSAAARSISTSMLATKFFWRWEQITGAAMQINSAN
jgi:hypothetical protein